MSRERFVVRDPGAKYNDIIYFSEPLTGALCLRLTHRPPLAVWSLDVSNPWPEVAKISWPGYPGLVENKRLSLKLKGLETCTRSGSKVPSRL